MMMFVNYTPSFPEPRTIQKLPEHFRSTTLPPKTPNPHHCLPSELPACPSPFFTPTYTVPAPLQTYPAAPKAHPVPNWPFPGVPRCASFEDGHSTDSQALTVQPNKFDEVFQDIEVVDESGRTVVDLTADTVFWEVGAQNTRRSPSGGTCDPADILRRDKDQDPDKETQSILDSLADPLILKSTGPLESLVGTEHPSPVTSLKPPLPGLDEHPDEEAYQELLHENQDQPAAVEAETNTGAGSATSTCSRTVVRTAKSERPKDATSGTSVRNTEPRQYPPKRRPPDAGSLQTMVAVVIPAAERHRGKKRRPPVGRKAQSRRHGPGHVSPAAYQSGREKGGHRDPSDCSDDDYTASSSDAGDSVERQPSKRRKLGSRSKVTTSSPSESLSRSQIARVVKGNGTSGLESRNMRSAAVATRSASSTHTLNTAPLNSIEQTLSCRWLSSEDISALVSAFTQKLLEYRRDPSPGPTDAADAEEAVTDTPSVSDSELGGKPGAKRSRWTRSDDESLIEMKARGWRWWEIEQWFPHRTKPSLQQRWSSIHRARAMEQSSASTTRTRKRKCTPVKRFPSSGRMDGALIPWAL